MRPEATATITVSEPVVVVPGYSEAVYSYGFENYSETFYPAQTIYSQDFQAVYPGVDGWTAGASTSVSNGGSVAFQLQMSRTASSGTAVATRTVTGLSVGLTYTLSAKVRNPYGGTITNAKVGVTGLAYGASVTPTATQTTVSYTFTATSTSHQARLEATTSNSQPPFEWDEIALTRVAYTVVHNNGMDGWSTGSVVSTQKRSGTYSLYANAPAKAFTGLVVGHQYTLRGWYLNGSTWTEWSETFTAVSTAQSKTLNLTGLRCWDDVELIHHVPAITTLTPALPISQGKVRLDENYSPYVTANFTVPLTSLELLEQIDPRNPQRVTVNMTEAVSGVSRTLNLGLRSRSVDHKAGTIDVELASDEILLHDLKRVATTVDSTPRTHEASLRALCTWALGKIGGTFAAGTDNADLTATWDATNLQTNPSAGANLDGWSASQGTTSRLTGISVPGTSITTAVRGTMNAGATGGLYFNGGDDSNVAGGVYNVRLSGKQLYRVSAWVRTSVSKTIRLSVQQRNSSNAQSGTNLNGPDFTTTANTWHRLSFVFQAYPDTVRAGVYCYLSTGSWSASQTMDMTGVMVTEGTTDTPSFDGSTTIRTDLYAYTWSGTPHLSTSERKAFFLRPPELFDWKPGQSLFDFLQPLVNASGLRLFCDENRVFRLVDPATYEVPGFVVAQTGHNATEGTDSITRNDDTWADAVVVAYTSTDADGKTQTTYDVAGDPNGKCIVRELNREYPGPGAAAAILASYQGRGRTQSVTVVGQYAATPGMDVTVNLPGTLTQTGKVRAAEFDLGSGLSRIETRGLTDALPGSWVLWNPTQTWSQVTPTLKWKDA